MRSCVRRWPLRTVLALAVVVPQHEISLVGGVMQAFQAVSDALDVGWLLVPTALVLCACVGSLAQPATVIRPNTSASVSWYWPAIL